MALPPTQPSSFKAVGMVGQWKGAVATQQINNSFKFLKFVVSFCNPLYVLRKTSFVSDCFHEVFYFLSRFCTNSFVFPLNIVPLPLRSLFMAALVALFGKRTSNGRPF